MPVDAESGKIGGDELPDVNSPISLAVAAVKWPNADSQICNLLLFVETCMAHEFFVIVVLIYEGREIGNDN